MGPRTAIIGDSHTQVLGPLLRRLLPNVVAVYANPGWSVKRWAAAPPDVSQADRVIVILGGNDRESSKTYPATLRKFISNLQGKQVIWFGPSQASGDVGKYHEQTRKLQASILPGLVSSWVDSSPWTGSDHRSDGVHFTSKGYQRWAEGIAREVQASRQLSYWWLLPVTGVLALTGAVILHQRGRR